MKTPNFVVIGVGAVFLAVPLFVRDVYVLQILIMIFFFGFLGSAWNIVGGYAGSLSLGHSAYVGIGAYMSSVLFIQAGITPWIGMIAGGLAAMVLSLAIGYPCLRLRGAYFALGSFAFAAILQLWFLETEEFLGFQIRAARGIMVPILGNAPLQFQFVEKWPYYYVILLLTGLLTLFIYWMHHSKLGFYLTAVRSNPAGAEAIGINVAKLRMIAFATSAFFSALGGAFYAQWILFFNPDRLFGLDLSFEIIIVAIVGGRGSVLGPVLGAFLLVPIGELTRSYLGGGRFMGIHLVLYGLALMMAIYFMPRGVNDLVTSLWDRLQRKLPGSSQT